MNVEDRTPDPLRDARYGVAWTAAAGMFDTAGWTPPAAGEYATFDGRRDYGPRGCVGIVLGTAGLVALLAVLFVAQAFGWVQ